MIPDDRTARGDRWYDLARLRPAEFHHSGTPRKTVAYTRVSSHDQTADLDRQRQVLEIYSARQGWTFEIVADQVDRLVVTHNDRLLRFGAEVVFAICEAKHVEVVILNHGEDTTFEEELAHGVLEIITVFSARLYGNRSRKNPKLLEGVKHAVEDQLYSECWLVSS